MHDEDEASALYAKFLIEDAAFRQLLPGLLERIPGQYVAIQDGKEVDHDPDEMSLAERIQARFRNDFVLIRKVEIDFDRTEVIEEVNCAAC